MNDSASIHVTVDRDFEHIVVICKAVQKRLRVKMIEEFYEIQNKNIMKKLEPWRIDLCSSSVVKRREELQGSIGDTFFEFESLKFIYVY